MDASAALGERMKAPAMQTAAGSMRAAGGERLRGGPGEGWQGWHLYLIWAEDGVDAAQHLFCVFSLGVPTDNDLSGESVDGRREKAESCDCTYTTTRSPPCSRSCKGQEPQPIPV